MKSFDELTPFYNLTAEEWGELDATAKDTLAAAARDTLERWQAWNKERKETTFAAKEASLQDGKRAIGDYGLFLCEWSMGVYDFNLDAIVEALNIHYEELWAACRVGGRKLVDVLSKRYEMTNDETASMLRKVLPIYKIKPISDQSVNRA